MGLLQCHIIQCLAYRATGKQVPGGRAGARASLVHRSSRQRRQAKRHGRRRRLRRLLRHRRVLHGPWRQVASALRYVCRPMRLMLVRMVVLVLMRLHMLGLCHPHQWPWHRRSAGSCGGTWRERSSRRAQEARVHIVRRQRPRAAVAR